MSLQYYEDIKLHQKYRSESYLLTQQQIIDFAIEYDPQPMHIDPEYARTTQFGGLFASGVQLIALCAKLGYGMARLAHIAGLGYDELRFLAPVYPGDRLTVESEVFSKRVSKSDPNAGVVRYLTRLFNQNEEVVLTYKPVTLVAKRPTL